MTKQELLSHLEASREQFLNCIDDLSENELTEPGVVGEWSIKDLLAHLSRWEAELIQLLWQVKTNQRPSSLHFDPRLSDDAFMDEVNLDWFRQAQSRPLERVLEDFHAVRNQTILRIEQFTDKDLFDPHRFPLIKGRTLATYIENDSYGHEEEHLPDVQKWIAQQKAKP